MGHRESGSELSKAGVRTVIELYRETKQQNQACVRKLVSYNNQIFVSIPLVVL